MTFKTFNIDYNSVTIDDTVIERPSYVPILQWESFWRVLDELDGRDLEDMIDEAVAEVEKEHERELADLEEENEALDRENDKLADELHSAQSEIKRLEHELEIWKARAG